MQHTLRNRLHPSSAASARKPAYHTAPHVRHGGYTALRLLLLAVPVALVLILAQSLLLSSWATMAHLPVSAPATEFLSSGFFDAETDPRGAYRWSSGTGEIRLPVMGQGQAHIFTLALGPTFAGHGVDQMGVGFAGGSASRIELDSVPRRYHFVVPRHALHDPMLSVSIQSETVTVPPDTRPVGVRVEQAALEAKGGPLVWLAPSHMLVQLVVLACGVLLGARLAYPLAFSGAMLVLIGVVLALFFVGQPLLFYPTLVRWSVALVFLVLVTYAVLPPLERYAAWLAPPALLRILWGVALLACALRLAGSLYPLFAAFDLHLNVERFITTVSGNLVVTSRSIEFRNGITVYPPGAYIVFLPGVLAGIAPPLLIQGCLAIVDGFGALTTALLACALGAHRRAAIFSALVYAAVPIHLTALWFGLTAQIFGQALMAPLAIALLVALRSTAWRPWLVVGALFTVSLLTHIGVAIIAVAWLGLVWLLVGWRHTISRAVWWRFAGVLAAGVLVSIIGIYGYVIGLKLAEMQYVTDKLQTSDYVPAYGLIWRAFLISFHTPGLLLAVVGLVLLFWQGRLPHGGAALMGGWLGVVGVFLAIELLTALQVRYIYFVTPLACVAIGSTLAAWAARSAAGARTAWLLVLLLLVQGSIMWYQGAMADVMMSMSPLLR
jgi:hypothetical protein